MTGKRGTETEFELTTIERLETLEYLYQHGFELERPADEVILTGELRRFLSDQYADLPSEALEAAVAQIRRPEGVDTIRRNLSFHQMLVRGFELAVELPDGNHEHRHIYPIDWENSDRNRFLVVNQLSVRGQNDRRPDIVIYVNGLPLVLFELKNPYSEEPTVDDAYNQIQHYRNDIPQIFDYNAVTVVSDGRTSLHGMWTSPMEWFAPWKSIDGFDVEAKTTGSMKTLIEGLFPKERLLDYIRHFIAFETANDQVTKKGAKYHQYFAVRLAARKSIDACRPEADKRIGVIWHTTGSGKSLSMAFLVGMLRKHPELKNPTFVIQVDRNDLDNQLHDQFVAVRSLVGDVNQADDIDDLRDLLRTEGGEVIFTTVEKFQLKRDKKGQPLETAHPVLSERSNVIVIADEAHRSQYGYLKGYARYLEEALPNARRIGFTGTPVSLTGADTVAVFGDLIHTYDILQSQQDKATVPIYYEPRQVKLHLSDADLDAILKEATEEYEPTEVEKRKSRWATLAAAARAKDRLREIAKDLLRHHHERTEGMDGKAMIVCMERSNCVRLYDALTALPECPQVNVVMTGNLSRDPPEWSEAGHITTKQQREAIKERMKDLDDPLRLVIVCNMWLTGTDIPCLHTLYVDKPMRGHSMIQAISRVNRVFGGKTHGLIVDYIGIGNELREATAQYRAGDGKGEPTEELETEGRRQFLKAREEMIAALPEGKDYGAWRRLSKIAFEDLHNYVYGWLAEDTKRRDDFLAVEKKLSLAFLLVKHLNDCRKYADEVIFCQRVRNEIQKTAPGAKFRRADRVVRDLTDDHVESSGVVDIFKIAGIAKPDISILDDDFLQTFKDRPQKNLRVELLQKLMFDEIRLRQHKNLKKYRSFREMLEETLKKYHARLVDAASVVRVLVQIRKDIDTDDQRAADLGLSEQELAFYDAVAANLETIYEKDFLRDLIHDVVETIKRNLKVDWTQPHRADVQAAVQAAVKRVLRKRKVRKEDLDWFLGQVMEQAAALYADWPLAA